MSGLVLFRRTLVDRRRWLIGWSLGIVSLVVLTLAFWPSFGDKATDLNDVIDKLPDSVRSLFGMGGGVDPFSPIGYLSSQVYSLMLPVLLLIAGIGLAASPAGDEEHGVLETTFSLPISRRRVVLERWLALVVLTGLLNLLTLVSVLSITRIVGLAVGAGALVWATVSASLLTWSLAGLAMAAGAVTGRRGIAITLASVIAVTSYVITSLADAGIGFFETLKPFSLFTHYDVLHTLVDGTPPWSLLVLVVVSLAGLAVALWGIDRRDLRAG
jgi:ABC-2 type transport system permease protein